VARRTNKPLKESDMKTSKTVHCVAALVAALVSGSVLAGPPADPSKTVSYADLNLKSKAGVDALYKRIAKAAYEVCQMPTGTRQIRIEAEFKACKLDAIDRAVQQVSLPALTALHQSKSSSKAPSGHFADRR
jgi:UrcA family protein